MLVIRATIHKLLAIIADRVDPDQTASSEERRNSLRSSPIWVCSVCIGISDCQLILDKVEHLPYTKIS